jgi:hypothetical protein
LLPALAGLEHLIRHEPNRTSIAENAEFLPSLVGQSEEFLSRQLDSPNQLETPRKISVLAQAIWVALKSASEALPPKTIT